MLNRPDPRDAHIADLQAQLVAERGRSDRLLAMVDRMLPSPADPTPAVATVPTVVDADAKWIETHPDDGEDEDEA